MPGDTKPHKARKAKKEKRQKRLERSGTIEDVMGKVWKAILKAEEVLDNDGNDDALKLRAVHAITQAASSYTKMVETGELEARLDERTNHRIITNATKKSELTWD